jgi:hypothetical protein
MMVDGRFQPGRAGAFHADGGPMAPVTTRVKGIVGAERVLADHARRSRGRAVTIALAGLIGSSVSGDRRARAGACSLPCQSVGRQSERSTRRR